ncbi:cytochrome P450 [Ceratobasidium sp. AG-I]|nr:cytochrome P450 [Ceratobasidium sp. AG-I]
MVSASAFPLAYFPVAVLALLVLRKLSASLRSPISKVPGPKGAHWLWGHEMTTFEKSYGDAYGNWIESFGTTYKIKGALFHPDILITADPGAIAQILGKETYSYVKSPVIRPLIKRLVGRSVLWAEGAAHKRMRHQLAPFFTVQATHDMFEVINVCAHTGAERLAAHVNANTEAKHGIKLNIMDWTWRVALDIIGRVGFDHDFGCGESENAKVIHRTWVDQVNAGFDRMGAIVSLVDLWELGDALALSYGHGKAPLVMRAFPFIVRLPLKAIKAQENIATIIVAGNETLSGSLGSAFWELARNPDVCARLRDEIAQLGHEPTYEDYMDGMPWLDAVTKETFRLHPAAPHLERVALEDGMLRLQTPLKTEKGDGITHLPIRAGQLILIPTHSIGRIKAVWGDDAAEFKPERWLDASRFRSASDILPGWNGLLVFSAGPRICIGYRLAVLEFKVTLATYVRRFEFRETGATIRTKYVGTLQPYVTGEEDKGQQRPLVVSLMDAEC